MLDERDATSFKVWVFNDDKPVGSRIAQRPQERMALAHEQPSTGPEQACDNIGPAADARNPAQCPEAGVDEIETLNTECLHRVIDVGPYETDIGSGAHRQVPGGLQRGGEKSKPTVDRGPSRDNETVSVPM
ncbi:hypothetical protein MSHO_22820 [Mycobacterium shottsii]|uniref:Uncharacterized protein n=1 Tax=Mycobacterium shottsii TaxID=133549 RepID=A0A7I7LBC1_9MYCO|nr:hypothetical protein MSHO_22820 [Mycobacterium shottsii]